MREVGVLRGGVIAPDGHLLDAGHRAVDAHGELRESTVVVEAGHCGELTWIDSSRVVECNQCVGVGRVTHHEYFDVLLGTPGDGFALGLEDSTVCREQVLAFHAVFSGHRPDEQRDIGITKCNVCIIGAHHAVEQRECTVIELHLHAGQRTECGCHFQELQNDLCIRSEHRARCNSEDEAVSDLSCCAGNGDSYWSCHGGSR